MVLSSFGIIGKSLSFNDRAPVDPPVIYRIGRVSFGIPNVGALGGANSCDRIGSPVRTPFFFGNKESVSGNVTHIFFAIRAMMELASPKAWVCSCVMTGM